MKAILYDKKNSPDVWVLRDIETPVAKDDEVLVKIHSVSVNAAEYRSMKLGIIPKNKIFGSDIAGKIEAIGRNVKKFKVGDDVFGDLSGCGLGGFAEYVAAPESVLALIPFNVSYETAAALPMASVTALQGMRNMGNIQAGQNVLICGAGGGVGMFAVQLAKHFGAKVTAVCGRKNVEIVRSIGADRVIDYTQEDFAKGDDRYDLVLVLNGNRSISAYSKVMAPKGMCVMSGGSLTQLMRFVLWRPLLAVRGKKTRFLSAKPRVEDLDFVIGLVEEGKINAVIDKRYRLYETSEAVRYLSAGHAGGKVVINI